MNGVGHEYNVVVVLISSQQRTISSEDARFLFLMHEQRIDQLNTTSQLSIHGASTNFATNNSGEMRDIHGHGSGTASRNQNRGVFVPFPKPVPEIDNSTPVLVLKFIFKKKKKFDRTVAVGLYKRWWPGRPQRL
ncbi:hypothetical protein ACOSQ4_017893 [Xanthoceras sorbifolium]